jgi:hypothetical protein
MPEGIEELSRVSLRRDAICQMLELWFIGENRRIGVR